MGLKIIKSKINLKKENPEISHQPPALQEQALPPSGLSLQQIAKSPSLSSINYHLLESDSGCLCAQIRLDILKEQMYSVTVDITNYPQAFQEKKTEDAIIQALENLIDRSGLLMRSFQFFFQIKNRVRKIIQKQTLSNVRLLFQPHLSIAHQYSIILAVNQNLLQAFGIPMMFWNRYVEKTEQDVERGIYPFNMGIQSSSVQPTFISFGECQVTLNPSIHHEFIKIEFPHADIATIALSLLPESESTISDV